MMKNILIKTASWGALLLLCTSIALAQENRIVHYDTDANANSKRPDFKGAVIAIDFGGTVAMNTKALFMKLGARDFVEGSNPCVVAQNVICVRLTVGEPQQVSSYGQTSGFGGFSYSSGGSFSGNLYPVNVDVFLVEYDPSHGGERPTVELGHAMCLAPAGSGTSYSSSYGRGGGGTYSSSSTNSLNATLGNAANQAVNRLLNSNGFVRLLSLNAYAKWVPGADSAVRGAFGK